MSFSNTTVSQAFVGNGVAVNFAFTIDYFDNEAQAKIFVYKNGVLQTYTTHYTIVEDAANADGICPGGTVIFGAAPALNDKVVITRVTPITQDSDYAGTQFPAASVEKKFDRIVMMIQESVYSLAQKIGLNAGSLLTNITLGLETAHKYLKWNAAGTGLENAYAIPDWVASTIYPLYVIVTDSNKIWKCISAHTSGLTFDTTKWVAMSGAKGDTGAQGDQGYAGPTGAKGDQGIPGANGGAGANGIFAAIASQAEAQAAVDNTKGMTPLRTYEEIVTVVPTLAVITALQTAVANLSAQYAPLNSRVLVLESIMNIKRAVGKQRINNNQAVAQLIQGGLLPGEGGVGNTLELSAAGARSARIFVEIKRKTDLETRFVSLVLLMHYIDLVWYIERESTAVLLGSLEGVTLSVDQLGDVGRIAYTSDLMAGVFDSVESYIAYEIFEIAKV
jgi:hypothetical protein